MFDPKLIEEAQACYSANFDNTTWFERALFFSWACKIENTCSFCYMSTLPKEERTRDKVRSFASMLAETLIGRECGWQKGFLSGGIGIFDYERIGELIKSIYAITGQKLWLNIGIIPKKWLIEYAPYVEGVIGTVETVREDLRNEICPDKPLGPIRRMFKLAREQNLKCGITFITGLGETFEDFPFLEEFIEQEQVSKIHVYGLIPQKGTPFEGQDPPSVKYQAMWIAKLRIAFPKLHIQCGIWADRADYLPLLFQAGANSFSKFPALRAFGKQQAKDIESYAKQAGRTFSGTLTRIPDTDWNAEIDKLDFDAQLKSEMKEKVQSYLRRMQKNIAD